VLLQIIQLAGSVLILAAFLGAQLGRVTTRSMAYLILNMVGSAVLAVLAAMGRNYGFLLLEGVWAIVSAVGIVGVVNARRPATAGD